MTPAARIAAAIELLDRIAAGMPAEKALTTWARSHRFAGSKDRAAIRDHVFDALRNRASFAHLGGGRTGRALMIAALRARGRDPATFFTGEGHAPAPLSPEEAAFRPGPADSATRLDCPPWLLDEMKESLGEEVEAVLTLLKSRAPVFVRANLLKAGPEEASAALAEEGIVARAHPLAETALEVVENARRLRASRAFADGQVELQDAASQAVCELIARALEADRPARILDYCAGGGGKSLALAAACENASLFAHDASPARMRDLPARARRAGARISILTPEQVQEAAPFDLVLADVPCSGSGAWRRSPAGKWVLTPRKLNELCSIQHCILKEVSTLAPPGGHLAYVTCSLLRRENESQIATFLAENPAWRLQQEHRLSPLQGGDGFYMALLRRE